ncbi:unnamed protein product [Macrosiphum euphorbiae]|uniref:P2X purinoreceptor 7 intracellular domain-containing protein n=1 Tax=Macrosiphum euphorbiae TaxID=13131 RepID=A0AAV0XUV4_9HEMI|nr:unnamed protein product [Macrosiphum euphorbiae]
MSIRPYSFEPTVNDIDMADIQPGRNEPDIPKQLEGRSKINVNDWCLCNKCIWFTTDQECICCFELEKLHKLLPHSNKKTCITEISSFSKIILDEEVLNITRQQIIVKSKNKSKKKMLSSSQPTNKMWRYICYKQFTHWINSWNSIGKGNRIVIPSCVVNKIRQKYPEQDGCYVGYKSCTL